MKDGISLLLKQTRAFIHIKVLDLRLHSARQSLIGIANRKENERIIEGIELKYETLRQERISAVQHNDTLIAAAGPVAEALRLAASQSANQIEETISLRRSKIINPPQFGIRWILYSTSQLVELTLARAIIAASKIKIIRETPMLPAREPVLVSTSSSVVVTPGAFSSPPSSGWKVGTQDPKLVKRINNLSSNRGPLYAFLYLALGAPVYAPIFFLKQGRGLEEIMVIVGCVTYIPLLLAVLFRYSRHKRQLTLVHELETIRVGMILAAAGQTGAASANAYLSQIAPTETLRQPAVEKAVWLVGLFGTFALRSILHTMDEYSKGAIVASFIVVCVPLLATILQYDAHRAIARIRMAQNLLQPALAPSNPVTVVKENVPLYAMAPFCGFPLLLVMLGFQLEKALSCLVSGLGSPAPETTPVSEHRGSVEQRLGELENLRTKGLITDDEYRAKRSHMLSEI